MSSRDLVIDAATAQRNALSQLAELNEQVRILWLLVDALIDDVSPTAEATAVLSQVKTIQTDIPV